MDCTVLGCGRPAFARGVCRRHYDEQRRKEAGPCLVPGCEYPATRGEICEKHYRLSLEPLKNKCSVAGCDGPVKAHGVCDKHYMRYNKHGHLGNTRNSDWGARESHPLYSSYMWHKRGTQKSMVKEWAEDFWAFVDAVGERPDGCMLRKIRQLEPLGPDNWVWKPSVSSKDKAAYAREWRANNKKSAKNSDLKKHYGITTKQYEEMLTAQHGVCAICGKIETGRFSNLAVDHCHKTGRIRGLLCSNCNKALGLFGDNPGLLRKAADYIGP